MTSVGIARPPSTDLTRDCSSRATAAKRVVVVWQFSGSAKYASAIAGSRDRSAPARAFLIPAFGATRFRTFASVRFHAGIAASMAGADRIVPVTSSESLESIHGVTRRTYPDHRHELHNEPDGPAIIDDVIAWLRSQVQTAARS